MIATLEPTAASAPQHATNVGKLRQTVSASRLNTWLGCRLKFYFRYVLGITKPKTAALHVGSTVHAALRLANLARWRRQPVTTEQLQQQFDLLWTSEQAKEPVRWEDGEEPSEKQTAWSLVEDRKSTRLNSSHVSESRMPSSA